MIFAVMLFIIVFLAITEIAYRVTVLLWKEKVDGNRPPSFLQWKVDMGSLEIIKYNIDITYQIRRLWIRK